MSPLARILRTVGQVLVALGAVTPAAVALLATVDVHVDGAGLAAVVAAAIALVSVLQNALEQAGLIPTLGAGGSLTLPPNEIHESPPVPSAPLLTLAEATTLALRTLGGQARIDFLAALADLEDEARTRPPSRERRRG